MRLFERIWLVFILWLASLVAALTTVQPIFFTLAYLFGGILAFSYLWALLNVSWVRVTRQTPSNRGQVGKFAEERFVLENTGPLPKLWIELKDHSELPNHRVSRVISGLGARRGHSWIVHTYGFRRGRFRLGPVTIASSDPFGLFYLQRELDLTSYLVIYPPAIELPYFNPPVGELVGGEASHRRTHYVTTNVSGVRDYAPGDSFNRIHWRSTARTGRLIVKEFELDPMADVWIVLDMDRRAHAGLSFDELPELDYRGLPWEERPEFKLEASTEEYGVAVAASLARHFLLQDRAVGLISYPRFGHREIAQSDRGQRQQARIMEMLAVTHAGGRIPLAEVIAAEGARFSRNTTAIIITPSLDPSWVAATRHLLSRGVRATAVMIDPAGFGGPDGADEMIVELRTNHVPTYVVHEGDPLDAALANPARSGRWVG
ncbi:MAG: DUF58 domain-containing protein [Anaerolineae bacterium]